MEFEIYGVCSGKLFSVIYEACWCSVRYVFKEGLFWHHLSMEKLATLRFINGTKENLDDSAIVGAAQVLITEKKSEESHWISWLHFLPDTHLQGNTIKNWLLHDTCCSWSHRICHSAQYATLNVVERIQELWPDDEFKAYIDIRLNGSYFKL